MNGDISWFSNGVSRSQSICRPVSPKYTAFGERIRHVAPTSLQCLLFCGGRACKYDCPSKLVEDQMAIKGLYSSWATSNILATSRPSTQVIKEFDVLGQFHSKGIASIINLQLPGEHANCGYGLEPGGFAYIPEDFMKSNIFYYNFGWNDYGVRSLHSILDMVKVMDFAITQGKVAVHCHAGLGRTGVLIACYLIYSERLSANQAIGKVRETRPKAIQTRGQIACVQDFAHYLKSLWVVFSHQPLSLQVYMSKQRQLLHGEEARQLKYIPKIIFNVCQRLLILAGVDFDLAKLVMGTVRCGFRCPVADSSLPACGDACVESQEPALPLIETKRLSAVESSLICANSDSIEGSQGYVPFIETGAATKISNPDDGNVQEVSFASLRREPLGGSLNDSGAFPFTEDKNYLLREPSCLSSSLDCVNKEARLYVSLPSMSFADSLAYSKAPPRRSLSLDPVPNQRTLARRRRGDLRGDLRGHGNLTSFYDGKVDHDVPCDAENPATCSHLPLPPSVDCGNSTVNCDLSSPKPESCSISGELSDLSSSFSGSAIDFSPGEAVARILGSRSGMMKILTAVERYKQKLNTCTDAWQSLRKEEDPKILSALMWSWLAQIEGPIIDAKVFSEMRGESENALDCIEELRKRHQFQWKLIECIGTTAYKLKASSQATERILRRLSSVLSMEDEASRGIGDAASPPLGRRHVLLAAIKAWAKSASLCE